MINLKNILITVILNTYQVIVHLLTDREYHITDILDQIRGLEKVTIVNNITPEEYPQKPNVEYTRLKIKFVTREDPKEDIIKFKKDMTTSDLKTTDMRIHGVKAVTIKPETLRRI